MIGNEYERVLFECHSAARDVDGLHDDEALDEICKVIYAKIFDERNITKQPEGTAFRFQTSDSALTRRTKWHSFPGCRSALEQEEW